jgi:hypothetical protein
VIRRRGFAERLGLFEYRENAVQLAVTVAAAVGPLVVAAAAGPLVAVAVAVAAAAAAAVVVVAVLLVAAPEAAAAVAAGTGWSSVPCGTAPIQDSDSKELRLPCRQI